MRFTLKCRLVLELGSLKGMHIFMTIHVASFKPKYIQCNLPVFLNVLSLLCTEGDDGDATCTLVTLDVFYICMQTRLTNNKIHFLLCHVNLTISFSSPPVPQFF